MDRIPCQAQAMRHADARNHHPSVYSNNSCATSQYAQLTATLCPNAETFCSCMVLAEPFLSIFPVMKAPASHNQDIRKGDACGCALPWTTAEQLWGSETSNSTIRNGIICGIYGRSTFSKQRAKSMQAPRNSMQTRSLYIYTTTKRMV